MGNYNNYLYYYIFKIFHPTNIIKSFKKNELILNDFFEIYPNIHLDEFNGEFNNFLRFF